MTEQSRSIEPLFRGWSLVNEQLLGLVTSAPAERLHWQASADQWPIWALIAHLAGARVYWLCSVLGEPGLETTPFPEPDRYGWEDDLSHPRSGDELRNALESSWAIVERCLHTWTPEMLDEQISRVRGDGQRQVQTRQLILMRLLTHDSFHSGEVSNLLGMHGLDAIDPWLEMRVRPED